MVRFHAVAAFDSGEWTVELAKGGDLAGETVTCTFDGSFSKVDIEQMIDEMVVFYIDFNLAPWEIEATIEWKGEAAHREWWKEWRARQDTQKAPLQAGRRTPSPPRGRTGCRERPLQVS